MENNKLYATGWVCVAIIACTLISCITIFSINANKLTKEKEIEFAKAGLHQRVEAIGKVIWVKN